MRRLRVALCLAGLALAVGCGGEEETGAGLPDALGYVPRGVEPLLGDTVVIATGIDDNDGVLFALETTDGEKAQKILDRLNERSSGYAVDGDPVLAGEEAPEVPEHDGALNGANRNQSRTAVFLAQLARKA